MDIRSVLRDRPLLLELFVASNLAFLVLDVVVAHSMNEFGHRTEWIPVWFAGAGAIALLANLAAAGGKRSRRFDVGYGRLAGLGVGWGAIIVGIVGLGLHLESQFFQLLTLRSLVYSAPFVAPLAFTGLGFLLLLNRMVPHDTEAWARWVIALALGGFVGNFLLGLVDHAQNGFFFLTEWIPVAAAALAVGTLGVAAAFSVSAGFIRLALGLMVGECLVGVLGFAYHLQPLTHPSSAFWVDRVVFGPPPFAPLLFADLGLLGVLGLVSLRQAAPGDPATFRPR